jgi:hypothetical protein
MSDFDLAMRKLSENFDLTRQTLQVKVIDNETTEIDFGGGANLLAAIASHEAKGFTVSALFLSKCDYDTYFEGNIAKYMSPAHYKEMERGVVAKFTWEGYSFPVVCLWLLPEDEQQQWSFLLTKTILA